LGENLLIAFGTAVVILASLVWVFLAKVFREIAFMVVDTADMAADANTRVGKV
jgi:hypothetical protein